MFDSKVAIDAAKSTFLRNGYSNTTLDELSAAMGINRPSLYIAFTDKETLYQRALQTYADEMAILFRDALDGEPSFHKSLRKLYAIALDAYVDKTGEAVGCMVACTAIAEAPAHPLIRQHAKAIMDGIDALVAQRVARAVDDGQLPPDTHVRVRSRLIVGVLHTLAMRSRAGTSRKLLDEIAAEASRMFSCPN
jgi:AcrR family transcriptional regulator